MTCSTEEGFFCLAEAMKDVLCKAPSMLINWNPNETPRPSTIRRGAVWHLYNPFVNVLERLKVELSAEKVEDKAG